MMARDHHLDQDVVTLFLQSDLMYDYARKYLSAEQLDIALPAKTLLHDTPM